MGRSASRRYRARSGMVLVLQSGAKAVPPLVNTLAVTAEGNGTLDLGWTALPVVDRYRIYRSILSGGGYEYIGETTASTYHDSGLTNAVKYYYVIVSVDDDSGLVSGYSNEDSGIPHPAIGWSILQWPPTITHTIGYYPHREYLRSDLGGWCDEHCRPGCRYPGPGRLWCRWQRSDRRRLELVGCSL